MPIIFREEYGLKPRPDEKEGFIVVTPTKQRFMEADGTDVRLDRVRVHGPDGRLIGTYLRDKMGQRFVNNFPGTKDDLAHLQTLPSKEARWQAVFCCL